MRGVTFRGFSGSVGHLVGQIMGTSAVEGGAANGPKGRTNDEA